MVRQNWRLRPSPAASVESRTWASLLELGDCLVFRRGIHLAVVCYEIQPHILQTFGQLVEGAPEMGKNDDFLSGVTQTGF